MESFQIHLADTMPRTDLIIVFDAGEVVEQGTHEELLGKKGVYAHLWQQQAEMPASTNGEDDESKAML